MRVILFGSSGMVGQGVLHECLQDARVEQVLLVVRKSAGVTSPKVAEVVHEDFYAWGDTEAIFAGYDTCFFCLGTSALGMKEADYRRVTYDLTLGVAEVLLRVGVKTFLYVSGQGTNANGRAMWARVKGETESALLDLGFVSAYMFRPGYIQPMHGIRSKTGWYQALYSMLGWMYPLLRRVAANSVTNTEEFGRALIGVAFEGYEKRVLENADIHIAAKL